MKVRDIYSNSHIDLSRESSNIHVSTDVRISHIEHILYININLWCQV